MGVVRAQPTEWVNSTIYTVKLGHFHVRISDKDNEIQNYCWQPVCQPGFKGYQINTLLAKLT